MYQLPRLKIIPGLVHGFSEVKEGNMSLRRGERSETLLNRKNFLDKLGLKPEECVAMSLEHGTVIELIDDSFRGRGMSETGNAIEADCLMTRSGSVFLFLLTGDCLPMIFYDSKRKLLALAHIGRINTPLAFSRLIVERFMKEGSRPEDVFVGIGPGARKESYVFTDKEVKKRVSGHDEWTNFLVRVPGGKTGIDLVGYNVVQLTLSGIAEKNIEVSGIDSISDKKFFSHYRSRESDEPDYRMATVVGIRQRNKNG